MNDLLQMKRMCQVCECMLNDDSDNIAVLDNDPHGCACQEL